MLKKPHILIAIDGPAGAGKTTIAKKVAKELGVLYLNTGAMYRAAGLYAYEHNIDPLDNESVLTFLSQIDIDVEYKNGEQQTMLNGKNVNAKLSNDTISEYASKISSIHAVREKMVAIQQALSKKQSLIIDGRDIGTVVLPNATHKFFLDASVEIRAKRRYDEYILKNNDNVNYEEILYDMKERDFRDTTREHSPLKKADDAIYIDSSYMTIEEVVSNILSYFER